MGRFKKDSDMKKAVQRLEELLQDGQQLVAQLDGQLLELKPNKDKWSKKEILGHLVDSAINNLQRFTEITYCSKPYVLRPYQQDALVEANRYQEANADELLTLWLSLNKRIEYVWATYTDEILAYVIVPTERLQVTLKYWVKDYLDHMAHHLDQISE